jgi:DNA-binding response OmpR family regulator
VVSRALVCATSTDSPAASPIAPAVQARRTRCAFRSARSRRRSGSCGGGAIDLAAESGRETVNPPPAIGKGSAKRDANALATGGDGHDAVGAGTSIGAVARLLIAEDDAGILEPLTRALAREGYVVDAVADGRDAVARATGAPPDLLILDLGLPGLDGLEACRRLRRELPSLPILILTARDEEIDLVEGLDAGADDYVAKPFRVAELLARVRALLRRGGREQRATEAGGVRVDPASRRAWQDGRELDLTPKEFDLLALLVSEAGTVVRRDRIMREVWDENWFGSTKTLDMHVSWLRRKLGDDAAAPRLIVTVRGVGLRFEA